MTGILQGLDLNFNLYLLIRFSGARSFNIEFMNLLNIEFCFSLICCLKMVDLSLVNNNSIILQLVKL